MDRAPSRVRSVDLKAGRFQRFISQTINLRVQHSPVPTSKTFAFRRLYDTRSALTMISQGVTEFATVNVKDFEGVGFRRVWSPLGE